MRNVQNSVQNELTAIISLLDRMHMELNFWSFGLAPQYISE